MAFLLKNEPTSVLRVAWLSPMGRSHSESER